jgi:hypothetical protein
MPVLHRGHTIADLPGRASLHAVQLIAWPPDRMNAICLASLQGYGEPRSERRHNTLFRDAGRVRVRNHFHRRAAIDPASIAMGNGAACGGSTGGRMTFCTISPTDIWKAFLVGPNTIDFLAQNPSFDITKGQNFFVNIFFSTAPRRRVAPASGSPNFPRLLPRPCQPLSRCLLPASAV